MQFDNFAADRQPHAHPRRLRCIERFEELIEIVRIYAHTRIAHGYRGLSRRQGFGQKHDFAVAKAAGSGLDCIHDQVQENLLELNGVTLDLGRSVARSSRSEIPWRDICDWTRSSVCRMTIVQVDRPESRRSFFHQGPDSVEHVTRTFAFLGDTQGCGTRLCKMGVGSASQRAHAFAFVTTAASGCLTSCAIAAANSPIVVTRAMWAS